MYFQKIRSYSFVTALLVSGCVPARASVTVFTDRITFQSATSNVNTIAFENIATLGGGPVQFNSGLTLGSVTFQGFDNTASTQGDLEVNWPNVNWNSGAFLEGPAANSNGQHIIATLPAGIFAVGSDIMLYEPNTPSSLGEGITVKLSTGATIYPAQTLSGFTNRAFIGFVSDTPISSITFFPSNDPAGHLSLDNFSTGAQPVSPAPEAATMLLCGAGILLMVWLFRRNINSAAGQRLCA